MAYSPYKLTKVKPLWVLDGDTIEALHPEKGQVRLRLYGIDAPELHQAYGRASKQALIRHMLKDGHLAPIHIYQVNRRSTRYNRLIVIAYGPTGCLNALQLACGYAWLHYWFCRKPVCWHWRRALLSAIRSKKGLWRRQGNIPPWIWRKKYKRRK